MTNTPGRTIKRPALFFNFSCWTVMIGELDEEDGKLTGIVSRLKTVAIEQARVVSEATLAGFRLIE